MRASFLGFLAVLLSVALSNRALAQPCITCADASCEENAAWLPRCGAAKAKAKAKAAPVLSQAERDAEAKKLLSAAITSIDGGKVDQGMERIKEALALLPSQAIQAYGLRSLGVAQNRAGRRKEALATFKRYIEVEPNPKLVQMMRDAIRVDEKR